MSLERFTEAQARVWPAPLDEIRAGRKESHWMWFVFPQMRGLGRSPAAHHYGLEGLAEARAFLAHPVLGPRLIEIAQAMLAHRGTAPEAVLGPVDALKLRSCATLFRAAGDREEIFGDLLKAFYGGQACKATCKMIEDETGRPA